MIRNNPYFFIPAFLYFLVCGIFLFIQGSATEAQLSFHQTFYSAKGAWWMELFTQWGEGGVFIVIIAIAAVLKRYKTALAFASTGLLVAAIVSILKHLVFGPMPRPMAVIDYSQTLLDPAVTLPLQFSFPSGHTTSAFAFFTLVALHFQRPVLQIAAALAAITVALSRVFLMVHWIGDTLAGAALGMLIALLVDFLFQRYSKKKAAQQS